MLISISLIAIGIVLLVVGGETLLRGAVGLATLLRLTPAIIGLTVVAAGTSVPELAVSGAAALRGSADISVGNVVGSNIFNIGFIIGLSALIRPLAITGNTIKLEYPVMALVTLMCVAVCQDAVLNWLDAVLFLAVYTGFTAYVTSLVRRQVTETEVKEFTAEVREHSPNVTPKVRWWVCASLIGLGIILLGGGDARDRRRGSRFGASTWFVRARDRLDDRCWRHWLARGRHILGVQFSRAGRCRDQQRHWLKPFQHLGHSWPQRVDPAAPARRGDCHNGQLVDARHHRDALSGHVHRIADQPLGRHRIACHLRRVLDTAVGLMKPSSSKLAWDE